MPSKPAGTYQQALHDLIAAVKEYNGEPIPPHEGETEHPLHLAVRNVESWWHYKTERRGPLPHQAWAMWLGLLAACRQYTEDDYYGRFRPRIDRQYKIRNVAWHIAYERSKPASDPMLAMIAARDLAIWAMRQLKLPEPDGTGVY